MSESDYYLFTTEFAEGQVRGQRDHRCTGVSGSRIEPHPQQRLQFCPLILCNLYPLLVSLGTLADCTSPRDSLVVMLRLRLEMNVSPPSDPHSQRIDESLSCGAHLARALKTAQGSGNPWPRGAIPSTGRPIPKVAWDYLGALCQALAWRHLNLSRKQSRFEQEDVVQVLRITELARSSWPFTFG